MIVDDTSEGVGEIYRSDHEQNLHSKFSLSVIESVGEVLGVDPTDTQLHLDESINLQTLHELFSTSEKDGSFLELKFSYGGFLITCSSCGSISITADVDKFQAGEVELPDSMHQDPEVDTSEIQPPDRKIV